MIEPSSKRHLVLFLMGALSLAGCGGSDPTPLPTVQQVVVSPSSWPPTGVVTNQYPGFSFSASGGVPPYTWATTAGTLPNGLTLASDGTLSGTPTATGPFTFTVMATDSAPTPGSGSQAFSVTIKAPDPLSISPGQTPPAGVHGTRYGTAFSATGGYLPLSWAVTAGTLPPGLTLSSDGTVSGTPTVASSTPFAFTVTVTDSSTPTPATNSVAYSITISEPGAPTINNTQPPTATVGSPYSFAFSARDGLAPLVWAASPAPMGGLAVSPDGILSGTPSTAGIFPITLTVTDALHHSSPATSFTVRVAMARPVAAFTPTTGSMTVARNAHTATLLQNGQVLIAGGTADESSSLASAELYDSMSQTFTATTGSMMVARMGHSATLLANSTLPNYGKVLVVGGADVTAELYDPTAGTFAATGSTLALHLGQTAALLQNGQVLIAGGGTASAELYNPSTGVFTATGDMTVSRTGHTATVLLDGRVLIAGGETAASAELYDPVSGTFTSTGSMSEGRSGHTATLQDDGTVLVTGPDDKAELFNPGTGTFSIVGELSTGLGATATLRADGTVLVAGGRSLRTLSSLATAQLFAPESGGFVATGPLITARDGQTATRLVDGTVLITGGIKYVFNYCNHPGCHPSTHTVLSSAELFK